ncbi:MAG TPA: hypothetical protein VEM32_06600 [Geobacteraceae bacterium]|nr:hypothetical protein [Geobacteraceae bacterium]
MALKRYNGPEASVILSVAGHEIGTCAQGESIVIPDELADMVEWPGYWEDFSAPETKAITSGGEE